MKNIKEKKIINKAEINGFSLKFVVVAWHDDGYIQTEEGLVKMAPESDTDVPQVLIEVEGDGYPLKGFTFEKACKWAQDCPQDLASLIFD